MRTLETEAEKFLIEYSGSVLNINKKYSQFDDQIKAVRVDHLEKLRKDGIQRIKGLAAEFGG